MSAFSARQIIISSDQLIFFLLGNSNRVIKKKFFIHLADNKTITMLQGLLLDNITIYYDSPIPIMIILMEFDIWKNCLIFKIVINAV